jgi:cyclopropane fatty-acyl-phospholipid synthase-like methyltransferase
MSKPKEWWEDFFDGITLDCWRQVFSEEHNRAEADFIEKVLELRPPARILDVPCGEGRLCRELASREFKMTGTDIAPVFLEEARQKAGERGLDIAWKQGDMRHLDWDHEFDGAFCMGGSYGYFEDAGHASFLKSVFRALKPGGQLVLDATRVAEFILPNYREREWVKVGDILFLEENRWDHERGRMETEYTFVRDGKTEKKASSDRIYTYREHCRMLEEAGFSSHKAYSSFSLEPFKLGSSGLFLVARK